MKVELSPAITNQKINLFTKIKRFFVGKLKLKNLLEKDTFVKTPKNNTSLEKSLTTRKYPNCIGIKEDYSEKSKNILQKRLYYPEDLRKMETMSKDEKIIYKRKLDKEKRYYYDNNYEPNTPALKKYFQEHGINLDDFNIKEKK